MAAFGSPLDLLRYRLGALRRDVAASALYLASPSERRALRTAETQSDSELLALAQQTFRSGAIQDPAEIGALLDMARTAGARRICEIGTASGATSLLLGRAIPEVDLLVGMDLHVYDRLRLRALLPREVKHRAIDGNSASRRSVGALARTLGLDYLDLLFIDGDHSWGGVRGDFLRYRRFVRPGGLIAFHDITPLEAPARGRYVGDVPQFWDVVRTLGEHHEFSARRGAGGGLGIGVLVHAPEVELPAAMLADAPPT